MYVTGGQYKGRKIVIPKCAKPTLSKTREGVFNVLFSKLQDFEGKLFLDLYSGSGIMSMEALSRGFKTISIDNNREAVSLIKKNLSSEGNRSEIVYADCLKYIKNASISPDVIYMDPPWDNDYKEAIEGVCAKFKGAILIVEYDKKRAQEFSTIYAKENAPFREKVYGRCKLDFIEIN